MKFNEILYEARVLEYPLGQILKEKYKDLPWTEIVSHNKIESMQKKPNTEYIQMKQNLIIGTRKTHKYIPNEKTSDYLVPYTSSGCSAMCLYCYLVCNYNKCSYLRLFVNREQMLDKLCKFSHRSEKPLTFEIGSNSDLVLENTITGNLEWTIPSFAKEGIGNITFPTKFHDIKSLLPLEHKGRTIFRMSVNPQEIIQTVELGTSSLTHRIQALNQMCDAGYPCGILIAPVILVENWREQYKELLIILADTLSDRAQKQLFIEVILMTYSYIHRAINSEAFPASRELYDKELMTGRGRGRYCYRQDIREEAESFLRKNIKHYLPDGRLLYIS